MSSTSLIRIIPLSRSLPQRAAQALSEAWHEAQAWWLAAAQRRRQARAIDLATELDQRLLEDIGLKGCERAEIAARREWDAQRNGELRLGMGLSVFDGRHW